jgi:hypothetical protein
MSDKRRDRTTPYLAILVENRVGGHQQVHAGLARHGHGKTMCSEKPLLEFWVAAQDPTFALYRPDGWRHRYAEAFLELNRGCPACLNILAQLGREAGWTKPKSLSV